MSKRRPDIHAWNRPWTVSFVSSVARAIETYTERKLTKLVAYEDPKVDGTYAFRAWFLDEPKRLDFLTIGVALHAITGEDLEEVEFDQWPPRSADHPTQWVVS